MPSETDSCFKKSERFNYMLTFNIIEMSVIAMNFLSGLDNLFFGFMLIVHNIFFLTVIHHTLVFLKITIFSNLKDLGF